MDYLKINKALWNQRTAAHVISGFYDVPAFLAGKSSLNPIELELLGDINGKSILHLQCHFGQDSISLSRMGANVTGVDFSNEAIKKARELAEKAQTNTTFIESDIYRLPENLTESFDIIYTSYGVIGWLPDLDRWAKVISHFLKPNGKLVFAEFHPLIWMFDDSFEHISYSYFNRKEIIEIEEGSYTDQSETVKGQSVTWNHSLAEVFSSLKANNMTIDQLAEYDHSPYNCLKGMVEFEPGKWRIAKFGDKIPLVYALTALRK
ncbi:class I SAM-dependent methyltransferase [Gangjinia marincola]|uniref:Class I SAM-dependent methyltransferase n=1 Tax=Gangjinia marincola TaxID=578463 RepID=A0ABN1MHB6_9FLAO